MTLTRNQLLLGVAGAALLVWLVLPKGKKLPPERAVQAQLDAMVTAAEKQDVKGIMSRISKDFQSPQFSRDQVRGAVFMHLQRGGWRSIFIVGTSMNTVGKDRVEVDLKVVIARGGAAKSVADVVPENAGAFEFELVFQLEDDEWMVREGTYKSVPVTSLL